MKRTRSNLFLLASSFVAGIFIPAAHAANGIWSTDVAGNWSDTTNWTGATVADGIDSIADFSTLDIAAGRTVTIDTTSRTVGSLKFGDTGATGDSNWTLASSGGATLTLATGTAVQPVIDMGSTGIASGFAQHTISAPLVGTNGFNLMGSNQVVFNTGSLTGVSGTATITAGRLALQGTDLGGLTAIDIKSGGVLGIWNNGGNYNQNISLAGTGNGETGFEAALRVANPSATVTLGGTITLTGNATIGGSGSTIFNGVIGGAAGNVLTFGASSMNTGTYTLNGANTYSGGTTIASGTLQIAGTGTLGGGTYAGNITNSGTLLFSTSANQTLSGNITGGALSKSGAGTLILTGATNTPTSTTLTANGGTLQIGDGVANGSIGTGLVTIGSGATVRLNRATAAGQTWGNFRGAGTLSLNSAQAISGTSGTANWGSTNTSSFNAAFIGTLRLEKGRLEVPGAPSSQLGGMTTIEVLPNAQISFFNGGTISQNFKLAGVGWNETSFPGALRLGNTVATIVNGTITLTANATITASNAAGNTAISTLAGAIGESAAGSGLTFGGGSQISGIYLLTAANTYTGSTSIAAGTLRLGNTLALQNSTLNHTAGTLQFDQSVTPKAFTLGGLSGSANIALQDNAGSSAAIALSVGNNNASTTYSGALSGAGSVTKIGNGTLTLTTGTHTYTGATTVSAGTLLVNGALGNTAVSVGADGAIGGTGTLGGPLSFGLGAGLSIVDINDALAIAGSVTFAGFGFSDITGWDYTNAANGTYTLLAGSNFDLANVSNVGAADPFDLGGGRSAYFQNGSLQAVIIPEPTVTLLGGIGMLLIFRRRRA